MIYICVLKICFFKGLFACKDDVKFWDKFQIISNDFKKSTADLDRYKYYMMYADPCKFIALFLQQFGTVLRLRKLSIVLNCCWNRLYI